MNILQRIAAVLAAMPRIVLERIQVAGEWISRWVSVPASPAMAPASPAVSAEPADEVAPIKRLAGVLAQGHTPEANDLIGVSEKSLAWLRAMNRRELCVLMTAKPEDVRGHLRGRAIRGMVPYDVVAIAAVTEARKPAPTAKGYRTVRDRLAELEAAEPAPAMAA